MLSLDGCLVDGAWTPGTGGLRVAENPATGESFAEVGLAGGSDVEAAVAAAARAFPDWSRTAPRVRAELLSKLRDLLEARQEDFARAAAREIGSPLWFSRAVGLTLPLRNLEAMAGALEALFAERRAGASLILREPMGVVAAITPWNAPLHQIVAKVGAALAAGCVVILKPSELAPFTARGFAEAVGDAGFPPGVFNMVLGEAAVGEALVRHPLVDMVSFTGSEGVGRAVAAAAAGEVKKTVLELGGKSASILLDDAPLEQAAVMVLRQCFSNSGQTCVAQSRLLVPRPLLSQVEALCVAEAGAWIIGDPMAAETRLGPLATRAQLERVRRFIETGVRQGARLIHGGAEPPDGTPPGHFIRPTIFSDVTRDMTIARKEIFGPVLCIMPYDDTDEAVEIANDSEYGLSGGVWSATPERGAAFARRMRTGQVALNGAPQNLATPFGGFKRSGYGRENGAYGVEEYLQFKVLHGI